MSDEHPAKRLKLSESGEATATASKNDAATVDRQTRKEFDCGITHFVNPDIPGFSGILKLRYTDFLVNEILPTGEVLHLKSTSVPSTLLDSRDARGGTGETQPTQDASDVANGAKPIASEAQEDGAEKQAGSAEISNEDRELLISLFGEEVTNSICSLYKKILAQPNKKPRDLPTVSSEAITDRQKRTTVHQALRRIFNSRLESSTEKDGTLAISMAARANKNARNSNAAGRPRGKLGWDERGGEYLHFTLHKKNKDTMEAISFFGSQLKLGAKHFQFAGTKDRRAVTVQRMSAFRLEATALARISQNFWNVEVGDFEYRQAGLDLGQSSGNEFSITLRDCHFPGEDGMDLAQRLELANAVISKSIESFGRKGFLNYFGLQRFGSFAISTATIGIKILQGDFKGAADALLAFPAAALAAAQESGEDQPASENDNSSVAVSRDDRNRALAIHTFRTDPKSQRALAMLPRKFSAENSLIRHLSFVDRKSDTLPRANDYQGALGQIPRNLRTMYLHAYQSLVWNTVAGKRWELFGDRVVAGDLVIVSEHRDKETAPSEVQEEAEVDESGEVVIVPEGATNTDDRFTRARALTADEAASGKYSIRDVVLPLPGWDVIYPANAVGEAYKDFMASEAGGGLDPHNMQRKHREHSLSGDYRKLIAGTDRGMGFEVKSYQEDTEQLVKTDFQKLQEAGQHGDGNAKDAEMTGVDATGEESKPANGMETKIAVILRFQLGSSQYATMALRELMKQGGLQEYLPYGGR